MDNPGFDKSVHDFFDDLDPRKARKNPMTPAGDEPDVQHRAGTTLDSEKKTFLEMKERVESENDGEGIVHQVFRSLSEGERSPSIYVLSPEITPLLDQGASGDGGEEITAPSEMDETLGEEDVEENGHESVFDESQHLERGEEEPGYDEGDHDADDDDHDVDDILEDDQEEGSDASNDIEGDIDDSVQEKDEHDEDVGEEEEAVEDQEDDSGEGKEVLTYVSTDESTRSVDSVRVRELYPNRKPASESPTSEFSYEESYGDDEDEEESESSDEDDEDNESDVESEERSTEESSEDQVESVDEDYCNYYDYHYTSDSDVATPAGENKVGYEITAVGHYLSSDISQTSGVPIVSIRKVSRTKPVQPDTANFDGGKIKSSQEQKPKAVQDLKAENMRQRHNFQQADNKRIGPNHPVVKRSNFQPTRGPVAPLRKNFAHKSKPVLPDITAKRTKTSGISYIQNVDAFEANSLKKRIIPSVPVFLKSKACFHDGQLQVSITADGSFYQNISRSSVKLTLVKKQLPKLKGPKPYLKKAGQIPRKRSDIGRFQISTNRNIIDQRAQFPPFNTHVNPEASRRFQAYFNS